jgi:hypothetical protein
LLQRQAGCGSGKPTGLERLRGELFAVGVSGDWTGDGTGACTV